VLLVVGLEYCQFREYCTIEAINNMVINGRCVMFTRFLPLLIIPILSLWTSASNSAVIYATSCSQKHVQTAINVAATGDTVVVPNGDCTWSTSVTINKAITLKGKGIYSVDASHADTGEWPLTIRLSGISGIVVQGASGQDIRVTGFHFTGSCPGGTSHGGAVYLPASNASNKWRVDNCRFSVNGNAVRSEGDFGVIDHIYSYDSSCSTASQICVADLRNSSSGDWAFAQPVGFGGSNFVFIEDSTFWRNCTYSSPATSATDAQAGGRFVFRHNYVRDAMVVWHGTESGAPERGGYVFEIYNNEIYWHLPSDRYHCAIYQRGGTALIHHNTVTNYQWLVRTWVRRAEESFGRFGKCDGTHPWDGNTIPKGYPCLDQVGRGRASSSNIDNAQPQDASKVHIWHNTTSNVGNSYDGACTPTNGDMLCHNDAAYVQEGRDYEYSTDDAAAEPGYTPYRYPHPLSGDSAPNPPSNLRILWGN
jgi:hypothetical protein